MNDLLKELASRANFGHIENNEVVFDSRLKKFAELIINECAECCIENEHFKKFSTASDWAQMASNVFKKKFDIET